MRVLVAFRVAAEFSIVQRGQVPCSLSFTDPQNGQTYFPRSDSRMPSAPAGCKAEVVGSVVCVTSPFKRVRIRRTSGSGSGPKVALHGDGPETPGESPGGLTRGSARPIDTGSVPTGRETGKFPADFAAGEGFFEADRPSPAAPLPLLSVKWPKIARAIVRITVVGTAPGFRASVARGSRIVRRCSIIRSDTA
jgi:hypothetical protein